MITNAVIRIIEHKGSKWFGLKFKYDDETIELVRSINGSRWSETLLGHSSIKTTQLYSHITDKNIKKIINPFDRLKI